MSREALRNLKADNDKKNRLIKIENIITTIYRHLITTATKSTETKFHIPYKNYESCLEFSTVDKAEILCGVQKLFPDCSVDYKDLVDGMHIPPYHSGIMYDISQIDGIIIDWYSGLAKYQIQRNTNLEEEQIRVKQRAKQNIKEYIVIDYS